MKENQKVEDSPLALATKFDGGDNFSKGWNERFWEPAKLHLLSAAPNLIYPV